MPYTCAVLECTNNQKQKKIRKKMLLFHRFPVKYPSVCRQWMEKCGHRIKGRTSTVKPENRRVCSDHFREDDYVVDLKSKLLGCPERKILKTTAVPSVFLGRSDEEEDTATPTTTQDEEDTKKKEEEEKQRRECLRRDSQQVGKEIERIIAENEISIRQGSIQVQLFASKRLRSKEDVGTLKKMVTKQRKEIIRLRGIINTLKSKAQREKTATSNVVKEGTLKKNLIPIFSNTQIRKISGKKVNWTKEDVDKAQLMHGVSPKAYEIALNTWKLPLPAIRTLKKRSRSFRGESETTERVN